MSDTNNSYALTIERNQLEEDMDVAISDLLWQKIIERLDDSVAEVMAELGLGDE